MAGGKFKKLEVWKDAVNMGAEIYPLISALRERREFVLSDQMWRSCLSISSNIAEGSESGTDGNFIRYLNIAIGSLAEFRSQLYLTQSLKFIPEDEYKMLDRKADQLAFRVYKLRKYLSQENVPTASG